MTALPGAMLGLVQLTAPLVAPTPGLEQLKPAGWVLETKIHPPPMVSFMVTEPVLGPLLVTVTLNVTSVSWLAVVGPVLETLKSLTCASAIGAMANIAHTNAGRRSVRNLIFDPARLYSPSRFCATWENYLCNCFAQRNVRASLRVGHRFVRDYTVVDVDSLGQPRVLDRLGEPARGDLARVG